MSIIPDDKKEAVKERILANCEADPDTGCWVWTGAQNNQGYGYLHVGRRTIQTHRASYIVHHGDIPEFHKLRIACKNTLCCNPSHMQLYETRRPDIVPIEDLNMAVYDLGQCARAVDIVKRLGLPGDRETLEAVELLLENPDHFKPLVANGKKYYQAI